MIREKEKEIEQFKNYEVRRWRNLEKGIISAIVTISGIIFGIDSIDDKILNPLAFLFWTIALGVFIYLLALIFRNRNEKIFDDIVNSNAASLAWHYSYGQFNRFTTKIEQYNSQDFEKFLEYFNTYVMVSAELSLYNSLKKTNRSYLKALFLSFPAIKKINSATITLKHLLDETSEQYENTKKSFETISIIQNLLIYGNALSRYRNGIVIPPTPRRYNHTKLEPTNDHS